MLAVSSSDFNLGLIRYGSYRMTVEDFIGASSNQIAERERGWSVIVGESIHQPSVAKPSVSAPSRILSRLQTLIVGTPGTRALVFRDKRACRQTLLTGNPRSVSR